MTPPGDSVTPPAEKPGGELRANLLIIGDVLGLVVVLAAMVWVGMGAVAADNAAMMAILGPLGMIAGHFGTGLSAAHQYEFGSSRGSKAKEQRLEAGNGRRGV